MNEMQFLVSRILTDPEPRGGAQNRRRNQKAGIIFIDKNKNIIPKKVELLIRFFQPFWILRVFHFFLGTFAEVEGLPDPLVASDETYTQSKFDISGSNETMQNALASIV